jgi:hypothetical protein
LPYLSRAYLKRTCLVEVSSRKEYGRCYKRLGPGRCVEGPPSTRSGSLFAFASLMYSLKFVAFLLLCSLSSCNYPTSFDRDVWVKNSALEYGQIIPNPRARMVEDVMKNHLKPGMSRKAVLDLLGQPYQEGIEQRLPKNTILPDSLSSANPDRFKSENQARTLAGINNFYRLFAKPVMLMRYPIGWATIDPNFLMIKLNSKGLVEEYWFEQG